MNEIIKDGLKKNLYLILYSENRFMDILVFFNTYNKFHFSYNFLNKGEFYLLLRFNLHFLAKNSFNFL
jgi:hypothetical protein